MTFGGNSKFTSQTGIFHAASSSGKSTASQVERPMHLLQRGKLASFSSICSSPQQSDAYRPVSITSCPVFITSLLPKIKLVLVCLTRVQPEVLCVVPSRCRIVCADENSDSERTYCYGRRFLHCRYSDRRSRRDPHWDRSSRNFRFYRQDHRCYRETRPAWRN